MGTDKKFALSEAGRKAIIESNKRRAENKPLSRVCKQCSKRKCIRKFFYAGGWSRVCSSCRKLYYTKKAREWNLLHPEEYKANLKRCEIGATRKASKKRWETEHKTQRSAKTNSVFKERIRNYKLSGTCLECGKVRYPGCRLCPIHRNVRHQYLKNRKALKRSNGLGKGVTPKEWEDKCAVFDYKCAYCGIKPEVLTQDHVIPLTKGGSHEIENVVPACGPCNSKKGTKTRQEFIHGISAV